MLGLEHRNSRYPSSVREGTVSGPGTGTGTGSGTGISTGTVMASKRVPLQMSNQMSTAGSQFVMDPDSNARHNMAFSVEKGYEKRLQQVEKKRIRMMSCAGGSSSSHPLRRCVTSE